MLGLAAERRHFVSPARQRWEMRRSLCQPRSGDTLLEADGRVNVGCRRSAARWYRSRLPSADGIVAQYVFRGEGSSWN
jgi:hypothetical protein